MGTKGVKAISCVIFCLASAVFWISPICLPLLFAENSNENSRVFVGASSNNFPPMTLLDENGNLTGFSRDLSDAAMKAVGAKVTHIHSSIWVDVLEWLDSGKADFIQDAGFTEARDEFLDYSKPIIEMPEMIFVRPDQYDITGLESLKGKKVACVYKHISHLYLETFPEIDCYVVKTPVEGLYELVAGKVDAFVYPRQIALYLSQNLRLTDKIKTTGEPLRTLTWSMVVKEGNREMLALLNKGIDKVKQTGEYDRIYDKWWGRKALAGYSKRELQIITAISVGISIVVISLIAALLYNYKLLVGKKRLEKEIVERKKAEEALQESEQIFRSVYESSRDAITINDENSYLDSNTAALEMFGYNNKEEFCQCHPADVSPYNQPDGEPSRQKANILIAAAFQGKGEVFEWMHRRKDGADFPTEILLSPMKWEGRDVVQAVVRDISERKRAEEAVRESEEKYRTFFENSADAMLMLRTGQFIDFNSATVDMLGYDSKEELYGVTPWDLSPEYQPDGRKSFDKAGEMIETAYARGAHRFEWDHERKDGSVVPVEVSLTVVPYEGDHVLLVVWRDITDRKRAEDALRKNERKLNAIFDHHYQLTGLIDTEGRLLAANRTALNFAGVEESEVIGQYLWDGPWWAPSQKPELQSAIERAAKGEFVRYETTHQNADGQIRDIDFSLSPIRDDDGGIIFVVPEGRDITEIKRTEQEKAKLQEQLNQAQKMESLGTLAGGIAHDFNNILSAIIGYSELSKITMPHESELSGYLNEILKAGNRAKDLVQQILTFSRQSEQELKPILVSLIVKEALKLLKASLPSTIEIRQNIKSDSLVMGDPTQIHQILMNLCTNAGHAMKSEGGVLEVDLSDMELDDASMAGFQNLKPGPYLKLTVSDTGHGMTPDILDRIFDPFYTTKEREEGTGLGLAVVHGIVEAYGGRVYAYSEPGQGSVFKVYLPVIKGGLKPDGEKTAVLPKGTERILFVDDEPAIVDIGKNMLERLGYQVVTRTNSMEALDLFESHPDQFDLVITDMTMPRMTGDKLTLKLIAIRKDIPVIICTGFKQRITDEKAKELGIKGLLMKPVNLPEMAQMIRVVLDESLAGSPKNGHV